jgi:predicted metalloprotease with PDZ domain
MFWSRRQPLLAGLALALSAVGGTAAAQQQQFQLTKSDSTHTVMSGGVSHEGRAELTPHEREANLKLVFTESQGSYLADIGVKVYDRNGNMVLDTVAAGPWLLAKLSPGNYRVVATDGNVRREHHVSVGSGLRTVQIVMPDQGGILGRPTMS